MRKIYWTIDIECHDINKRNLYIDGNLKNGKNCGMEHILQLANKYNIPINCFLDIPEALVYGDDYIKGIINLIHKYNQKVYLHLHPDYITGDHERSFLWQYNYEEKKGILEKGFALYRKFLNKDTYAFRIGRYGADSDMYKTMRELGIRVVDLSYCYNKPRMCHIDYDEIGVKNKTGEYQNQIIRPNIRYCGFSLGKKKMSLGLDFNDTTTNEFRRIIDQTKLDTLVITMHSWNFIKKYFFLDNYISRSWSQERRFVKMVKYAKKHGFEFADLETTPPDPSSTNDEYLNLCDSLVGKIMMIPNNFFRFYRIAALDRKYFLIYSLFFAICFIAMIVIALMIVL
jgi:hypothetical protein